MKKWIKLFLRLAIAVAFLSAVADRLGLWPPEKSAWGDFDSFLSYTAVLTPWAPDGLNTLIGWTVTILEVIFGLFLIIGFHTKRVAQFSGMLLLVFALSMTFTGGLKGALDYSVFTAAAAAFGLSLIDIRFLELDEILKKDI